MIEYKDGRPIHFPAKPDKFEFDAEVSNIFDDMAKRSIPGYAEMHRLHGKIVADHIISTGRACQVADVGASTGNFISQVCEHLQNHHGVDPEDWVHFYAFDTSDHMLQRIADRFNCTLVTVLNMDAVELSDLVMGFEVINATYVLQFIPKHQQYPALRSMTECLTEGGLFLFGHKERQTGTLSDGFNELYMEFRRINGYSPEEITAKTTALKNSMWPVSEQELRHMLTCCNIGSITPTIRWLQFNALIGIKQTND